MGAGFRLFFGYYAALCYALREPVRHNSKQLPEFPISHAGNERHTVIGLAVASDPLYRGVLY